MKIKIGLVGTSQLSFPGPKIALVETAKLKLIALSSCLYYKCIAVTVLTEIPP